MSEHESYRLSVRFGEEILARGHTAIPNLVLNYYDRLGVSGPEILFTIHVWQHWWSDRDPYPALRTIASRMGISPRQAKRYVESLEAKGLLRVVERFLPDGSQTTNEFDYSPLIHAVVAAARADGALEPGAAPAVTRRPRQRSAPGDISDTPADVNAVTAPLASVVTPAPGAGATGPWSAPSPKEDRTSKDASQPDGEVPSGPTTEDERALLDLFREASGRPADPAERALLRSLLAAYAPLAAQANPPALAAEWVAAALVEALETGAPLSAASLRPILDRFSAPPRPAGPALTTIWETALADLREQILPTNFARWLSRARLLGRAAGEAVVGVPDRVSAEQLARRFDALVRQALSDACGEPVTVRYEVVA